MSYSIRTYQSTDREAIKVITWVGFAGVSLDHALEEKLGGELAGHDWRWRKTRHVDDDVATHAEVIFVAEAEAEGIGYISTERDREEGKGNITNLEVAKSARGQGIGRELIGHALDYFRRENLAYAVIETLDSNPIGQTLYPATGFQEIARQVHYAQRL